MSRKAFENYMALYWKLNGRWPDSESIWNSATAEQADQLTIAKQRISELEQCIERQAKSAIAGMDAAKSHGVEALKAATDIQKSLKPELIESEREINAFLTEENAEQAEQIFHAKRRIAELEKDCEILQTNLDDAFRAARYESDLCEQALAEMKKQTKEIERLRAWLQKMLDWIDGDTRAINRDVGIGILSFNDIYESLDKLDEIAHEALKGAAE